MTEEVSVTESVQPAKRKAGRPRKVREPIREPIKESVAQTQDDFVYTPEEEADRLKVPAELIPDGMTYQWITTSIYGQPQPQRLTRFQRQGWTPVPASRHDGMFMPKGWKGPIEVDGLVLHERPKHITDQAKLHELKKARGQISAKEAQLLGGGMDGVSLDASHPTALRSNKISKSYERLDVPKE